MNSMLLLRFSHWLALLLALLAALPADAGNTDADNGDMLENQAIRSLAPLARRDGKGLILRINNKRTLTLRDSTSCDIPEQCLVHRLRGLSPDRQFFAVRLGGYEYDTVVWIGRNSGTRYQVHAEPAASPDGKWIVTANPLESGGTNGVFIWQVRAGELAEKLHYEPVGYALYSFVRWQSNDTILLRKTTHAIGALCPDAQLMEYEVTVRHIGTLWKFDERSGLKDVRCR